MDDKFDELSERYTEIDSCIKDNKDLSFAAGLICLAACVFFGVKSYDYVINWRNK